MSRSYLRAGPGEWSNIDDNSTGVLMVVIDGGGRKFHLAPIDVEPYLVSDSKEKFIGAILNSPQHVESYNPWSFESSVQAVRFEAMSEHLPLRDLRKSGVVLQNMDASIYWGIANRGFSTLQSLHLYSGKVSMPAYDSQRGISSFELEDVRLQGEKPFPPVIASRDLISTLVEEDSGKPYPVVVGNVKKLPLLEIDDTNHDNFLVMHDPAGEWSSPSQVSAIYSGDEVLTKLNENQGTDSDGNSYVQANVNSITSTRRGDVTADVEGHTPSTPGEAIRYLMSMYSDLKFDSASLNRVDTALELVTLGLAFNSRARGVMDVIRGRLCKLLPIILVQRGDLYEFSVFDWSSGPIRELVFGNQIMDYAKQPAETRRGEISTEVVVRYGRSGFRGEYTGVVSADKDSSNDCRLAFRRYGYGRPVEIDGGDLSDETSARWLLNYLVKTYCRMRVTVSYQVKLQYAVDLRLGDTVMITDDTEGWSRILFKVTGIRRGTDPTIVLDLLSVDDYIDVYGANS